MSKQCQLPCWEIIQCNLKDICQPPIEEEKACWQVVKEDNTSSFHICVDCLVYLAKQDDSIFSDEELYSILSKRQENEFRHYDCKLAYARRHSASIMDNLFVSI